MWALSFHLRPASELSFFDQSETKSFVIQKQQKEWVLFLPNKFLKKKKIRKLDFKTVCLFKQNMKDKNWVGNNAGWRWSKETTHH